MVRPDKTRRDKPSGREIAQKAKAMRLDRKRSVRGQKNGKAATFTGADLSDLVAKDKDPSAAVIAFVDSLADGQALGLLETELEGEESNLPAGKFNLLIANVNDEWKGYAEAEGEIVAEAFRVSVEQRAGVEGEDLNRLPEFTPEGCWCFTYGWWVCTGDISDFSCKWVWTEVCF